MKKLKSLLVLIWLLNLLSLSQGIHAQNVGIGTNTPAEKLHVVGNLHLTGTIKPNGVTGQNNQVLMTNSSGNLVWSDIPNYKYVMSTLNDMTWVVPAGVTRIFIEAWGAGGGGASGGGGCGGTYVTQTVDVTPGASITINIGGGGDPATSETGSADDGENTTVSGPSFSISAIGGVGANANAPGHGSVFGGPNAFAQYAGESGRPTTFTYAQISGTVTYEVRNYGAGGATAPFFKRAGEGGVRVYNLTSGAVIKTIIPAWSSFNGEGGGGGPRGTDWGVRGAPGHVIIHY